MNVICIKGMKFVVQMFFDGISGISIQVMAVSVIALLAVAFMAAEGWRVIANIFESISKVVISRGITNAASPTSRIPNASTQIFSDDELIDLILILHALRQVQEDLMKIDYEVIRISHAVKILEAEWDRRRR